MLLNHIVNSTLRLYAIADRDPVSTIGSPKAIGPKSSQAMATIKVKEHQAISEHWVWSSSKQRNDAFDGLRAIAITAVVIYHANQAWLPGGFFGVTVFFVLSGYLTTLSVARRLSGNGEFPVPEIHR